MKSLVIGNGEVGTSLGLVLNCEVVGITKEKKDCDVLHICFPYSDTFEKEVKRYVKLFDPKYTVIHSTVPIGTSRKLNAYHSPIRGMHPNLADSITTFTTYLAPYNEELKGYFKKFGMKVEQVENTEDTEALKLFDTLQYGIMIMVEKEIHRYCEENGLDFDIVYTHANETYKDGYIKMGRENVVRPILSHMGGEIGGHCVIPNTRLLKTWLADLLRKRNEDIYSQ